MLLDQYQDKHVVIQIIGKRPKNPPCLRVGFADGEYIASEQNANAMRGLARQILRAPGDLPR